MTFEITSLDRRKKMHQIMDRLQCRLKALIINRFLRRKGIKFDGIPSFSGSWPNINNEGKIFLGVNCYFRSFRLRLNITVRKNAELEIGDNSLLNDGVNICATQSIRIGHHAKVGDMTYIYDTDFHEVSPDAPINHAPVSIGNNVWIGAKSMILAGSIIGHHSVIAAGSMVNGEIPAKSLVAGSPARLIKTLNVFDGWIRK
jgi:acetyltransferase-like isoleucine patch superfamily enzyme